MTSSIVALIPARAGSKRIPGKNTRLLGGVPLIAYTIAAAKQSGIFEDILVCTDSDSLVVQVQNDYAQVGIIRRSPSADDEPDIAWVSLVCQALKADAFAILRPTSPFRTAETIQRAWAAWQADCWADSLRAVEPCAQHPGKMWTLSAPDSAESCLLTPLLLQPTGTPWHSSPTQTLPKVWVQTAGLEIAWTETVRRTGTIAGDRILAFETQGWEGFDLNTERDWWVAERAIALDHVQLPQI